MLNYSNQTILHTHTYIHSTNNFRHNECYVSIFNFSSFVSLWFRVLTHSVCIKSHNIMLIPLFFHRYRLVTWEKTTHFECIFIHITVARKTISIFTRSGLWYFVFGILFELKCSWTIVSPLERFYCCMCVLAHNLRYSPLWSRNWSSNIEITMKKTLRLCGRPGFQRPSRRRMKTMTTTVKQFDINKRVQCLIQTVFFCSFSLILCCFFGAFSKQYGWNVIFVQRNE